MHRLFSADGSCTEGATAAAAAAFVQAHHGEPVWVDIEAPDDADFALLRDTFGAHPLTIEDIRNQNQRPKLEEYAEYVFLVLFVTEWNSDEPVQREHHIYFNPARRTVITVHLEPAPALDRLRARIIAAPELARRTVSFLFYLVIDTLVDALFPVLDRLDDEIDDLEDRILGRQRPDVVSRLYGLKRTVIDLRRFLGPQRDLFQRLTTLSLGDQDQELKLYFRDVYDHLVRQYETVDSLRDLLTSAMDVYLSTVSNRLNDVMKRLTVITTLFMPLSFITGFFGMNFGWLVGAIAGIPAFVAGLSLMAITVLVQLWFFRRRGWV